MLTGKAKELFEKWLNESSGYKFSQRELFYNNRLTPSMQWGVYQDWAESLGYKFSIDLWENRLNIKTPDCIIDFGKFNNRQQAMSVSIFKLNELINK